MNIWVPRMKIIEPKRELVAPVQMQGRFRMQVYRPDGRMRHDTGFFPNLILDRGLNAIGTSNDWMRYVQVGTGSTAPDAAQTSLVAHVAGENTLIANSTTAQGSAPYYGYQRNTWRFGEGAAAGNLAEVGVASSSSAGANLFSRALILDGDLNPTTLTVLEDEFLDVTYELRAYPPLEDGEYSISIGSESYDVTARASDVTSGVWAPSTAFNGGAMGGFGSANGTRTFEGAIGAITANPSGAQDGGASVSNLSYGASNLYRDYTATWGLSVANYTGGILSIASIMGIGKMQYQFDPPIPKDNTKRLVMTFRNSWGRKT